MSGIYTEHRSICRTIGTGSMVVRTYRHSDGTVWAEVESLILPGNPRISMDSHETEGLFELLKTAYAGDKG